MSEIMRPWDNDPPPRQGPDPLYWVHFGLAVSACGRTTVSAWPVIEAEELSRVDQQSLAEEAVDEMVRWDGDDAIEPGVTIKRYHVRCRVAMPDYDCVIDDVEGEIVDG